MCQDTSEVGGTDGWCCVCEGGTRKLVLEKLQNCVQLHQEGRMKKQ